MELDAHGNFPDMQINPDAQKDPHGDFFVDATMIAIAGGSASGKTSIAGWIAANLQSRNVIVVSMDCFYKRGEDMPDPENIDWDHPDAFDWSGLRSVLSGLLRGDTVTIPTYDYANNRPMAGSAVKSIGETVVIFEGILALHDKAIREMCHRRIFIDCDPDIMLSRRIRRDVVQRDRSIDSVLGQWGDVRAAHIKYVLADRYYADISIDNSRMAPIGAVDMVVNDILAQGIPGLDPVNIK